MVGSEMGELLRLLEFDLAGQMNQARIQTQLMSVIVGRAALYCFILLGASINEAEH